MKFPDISEWKSAKNQKWLVPRGKIWPNFTTEDNMNEARLT